MNLDDLQRLMIPLNRRGAGLDCSVPSDRELLLAILALDRSINNLAHEVHDQPLSRLVRFVEIIFRAGLRFIARSNPVAVLRRRRERRQQAEAAAFNEAEYRSMIQARGVGAGPAEGSEVF